MLKELKMIRPSKHFAIIKKDLENGLVKKKEHAGLIEYWAYRRKKSSIVSPTGGNFLSDDVKLHAIVVCARDHITLDNKEKGYFEIEGIKFTNDIESNDLDDYLKKTKRGYFG